MKIRAAISSGSGGNFEVRNVELDAPRDDEILVRIAAVGLCHTDIVAHEGFFAYGVPAVLGHEGAGVVEAIGAKVGTVKPGDRVAISFRSCGDCAKCRSGHPAYCAQMPLLNYAGMRPDGSRAIHDRGQDIASNFFGQSSLASHALAYERNVVRIDDDIPFEFAAPLGCGVQTGMGSVFHVFKGGGEDTLVIAGGGTVGLSAVMAAKISSYRTIIVIEPLPARRALARELGATHTINPKESTDLVAAIRECAPEGATHAFDTTGLETVLETLVSVLAPQGVLGCVGIPARETRVPGNLVNVMTYGHSIAGIIEGDSDPQVFLPKMMQYYREGRLPLNKLVKTFPLDRINDAVAQQHEGACVKVVLTLT